MPLVDPVYQIKVNPLDGIRRSWDPQGLFASLVLSPASMTVVSSLTRFDQARPVAPATMASLGNTVTFTTDVIIIDPTIGSVNSNIDPSVGQSSVVISGGGFGNELGTVTYNGHPLTVLSWAPTGDAITVAWPDLPFDSVFIDTNVETEYPLVVTRTDTVTDTAYVNTVVASSDSAGAIATLATNGIYYNDSSPAIGDSGYGRVIAGSIDTVDMTTGIMNGVTAGSQLQYAVWDVSLGEWLPSVIETFAAYTG